MTAQVPDQVHLDGEDFALAEVGGAGLFEPAEHGIAPMMISTACWRGYLCGYDVADGRLWLSELALGLGSTVGGEPLSTGTSLFGRPAEPDHPLPGSGLVFTRLALPVAFTGRALLGRDFVRETYVHMGHAPAWKYRQVVELLVDDGSVTAVTDRSDAFAEIRARRLADGG